MLSALTDRVRPVRLREKNAPALTSGAFEFVRHGRKCIAWINGRLLDDAMQ